MMKEIMNEKGNQQLNETDKQDKRITNKEEGEDCKSGEESKQL